MKRSQTVLRALALPGLLLLSGITRSDVPARYPEPEDGSVKNGVFHDEYFDLDYPLPTGWVEDLKGPEPSASGYYSLAALKPEAELSATIQISAQDNFFASDPPANAAGYLAAMKQHLDPSLSAPETVATIGVAGRSFARLDYSGAGLHHSVFATEIRCHTLIVSITANSKEAIAALARSLGKISSSQRTQSGGPSEAGALQNWPVCVSESAYSGHIAHREDPVMAGPRYATVPARIIVGADGKIKHLHAIAGFPEQIKSVTDALARWEFKPYIVEGKAVEVETGILFQFPKPSAH